MYNLYNKMNYRTFSVKYVPIILNIISLILLIYPCVNMVIDIKDHSLGKIPCANASIHVNSAYNVGFGASNITTNTSDNSVNVSLICTCISMIFMLIAIAKNASLKLGHDDYTILETEYN